MSEGKNPILFPQKQSRWVGWRFFAFFFLAKGELIFAFRRRLLGHLSGPVLPPGTGEEQKSG